MIMMDDHGDDDPWNTTANLQMPNSVESLMIMMVVPGGYDDDDDDEPYIDDIWFL